MTTHEGGCHCGKVRFRVTGDLDRVIECSCSICARKGYLHWIVPPERFELLSGADSLETYEFNTRTARHQFCRFCGIHSFYVPRSHPDRIDVNVRCLDGMDPRSLRIERFDGKNWEEAIRKAPWHSEGGGT